MVKQAVLLRVLSRMTLAGMQKSTAPVKATYQIRYRVNSFNSNFSEESRGVEGTLCITGRRRSDGCSLNSHTLGGILAFKWQEEKRREDGSCSYSLSSKNIYLKKTSRMGPPVSWSLKIRDVYLPNVRTCPHVIDHTNEQTTFTKRKMLQDRMIGYRFVRARYSKTHLQ